MKGLFDVNAFWGHWPFSTRPPMALAEMERRLRRAGVAEACVSPLEAVFAPEPMPANERLFAAVRGRSAWHPVPIVNPALADWREQVRRCVGPARVRALRLLPNYHGCRLNPRKLAPFMSEVAAAGVALVVTVRLVDERQEYHALNMKGVALAELAEFANAFGSRRLLLTGLYREEIRRLAELTGHFATDLSFAEGLRTVEAVREFLPVNRILFGSAFPLFSVDAQAPKVTCSSLRVADRIRVASGNARQIFAP
jgi:predicted TIM-barrel fold metal-dependent hydrolase